MAATAPVGHRERPRRRRYRARIHGDDRRRGRLSRRLTRRARRTTVTTTRTRSRTPSRANVASTTVGRSTVDGNGELDDYVTIVSPAGTSLARRARRTRAPSDNPPPEGVESSVTGSSTTTCRSPIPSRRFGRGSPLHHSRWLRARRGVPLPPGRRVSDPRRTGPRSTRPPVTRPVQLQDRRRGRTASPRPIAIIRRPVGRRRPATSRSITDAVVSGSRAAPNFTFKHESCPGKQSTAWAADATHQHREVPVAQGANKRPGWRAPRSATPAPGTGAATGSTQLSQKKPCATALSVDDAPTCASGWNLTGISLAPATFQPKSERQLRPSPTQRNPYLEDDATAARRPAPVDVSDQNVASITMPHKKGRPRGHNGSVVNKTSPAPPSGYTGNVDRYTTAGSGSTCTTRRAPAPA
jgi:hypothetical protein